MRGRSEKIEIARRKRNTEESGGEREDVIFSDSLEFMFKANYNCTMLFLNFDECCAEMYATFAKILGLSSDYVKFVRKM